MKITPITIISILLITLFISISIFLGYGRLLVTEKFECDYFSQEKYSIDYAYISIENQKCKFKNGKLYLFFDLNIQANHNTSIIWKLSDLKLNQESTLYFDSPIGYLGGTSYVINSSSFRLYAVFDNQNISSNLKIIESGIFAN